MKREVGDYIQDIVDAISKGVRFIDDMKYEDFIHDDKTVFAVIRAIEVIGEAVKNIPDDVKDKYPEIPWRDMAGMRNLNKCLKTWNNVEMFKIGRALALCGRFAPLPRFARSLNSGNMASPSATPKFAIAKL